MPSFNFKKEFADSVRTGRKHQTIRAKRKNRPRPGQTAFLFTGLRTVSCKRLGEHPIENVHDITITKKSVAIDGEYLQKHKDLTRFAKDDGFTCFRALTMFFEKEHGLPFNGDLIIW